MDQQHELPGIFAAITDAQEMESFFREIFTPKELKDLALRWQLLKELYEGQSQRGIAERHGISLCKITRGSKILKQEHSITRRILATHYAKKGNA